MNENVEMWVKALRSKEYAQTTQALRRLNGFCCMGVLCDVYKRETGIGVWRLNTSRRIYLFYAEDDKATSFALPKSVQKWAGLNSDCGDYVGGISLTSQNDNGTSFEVIADIIESTPELFR